MCLKLVLKPYEFYGEWIGDQIINQFCGKNIYQGN